MTDRTDNFNRADGGLGANWTTRTDGGNTGSLVISTNKVVVNANFQDSVAYWSADSFPDDQYSQAVFTLGGGGNSGTAGIAVRITTSGTLKYYDIELSTGAFSSGIVYYDGTTWNTLTTTTSAANGDLIRFEVTGTTLTAKVNGTTLSTTTDANIASGSPGMHIYDENSGTFWDDWLGGPISSGASPFIPIDTSIQVQSTFPVSLRTWTASYNPNLVGKDVFPPGRKGFVFDGPPKAPRPAGPTWTSRYNDNLIGQDVFPSGRRNPVFEEVQPTLWRREWTQNLLLTTLAPVQAALPFRQQDWPLPIRSSQPDRTWVSSATTLQLTLPPPGDIWTDLPPGVPFWRNGSVLNLVLSTLVAQDRFPPGVVRSERPPPLDWRNSWTLSLLQTTLAPTVAVPFAQYDWPLPRVAPQPSRSWAAFFNPNLVGQDAFPPGAIRTERPPPLDWRRGFELNLVLSTLASVVQLPLNQYNWPLPGQSWQPPRTWASSYNINLIGQDQLPFRQTDWPLPNGYFYPANVRVAVPLNINLFPPPVPPVVTQEYRAVKVAGGEFGFMGLRGGVIG